MKPATVSAATVKAATEKELAEVNAAEIAAEKAFDESETVDAKETVVNTFCESDNLPSTSCSGQLLSKAKCWNCDREMSGSHQCDLLTDNASNCETLGKAVSSVTPPGSPEPAKTRGWGPPTRRRIY